jgi:hypothetical protein
LEDYNSTTSALSLHPLFLATVLIKILYFIRKILQYQVFYKTFESTLSNGEIPDKNEIIKIILSCNSKLNNETADRRSSTVRRWIEWILSMISDE